MSILSWAQFTHLLLAGYFQHDNAPCHRAKVVSNRFHKHDNEFIVLHWPSQSPDVNPIEHLWNHSMKVHLDNLQELSDAIMSTWTRISKNTFQHFGESMPQRIKADLRAKEGAT